MSRRRSRYMLGAEGALIALVFVLPLSLGSAPLWALWPLCILAGAASVLAAIGARREGRRVALPLLGAALILASAFCLLQLIPLPGPLLRWASPPAAELKDFALVPLGLSGTRPVSLDPSATWRELAKHLSYVAIFFASALASQERASRRKLGAALALSGALIALIGLGHKLLNVPTLLGAHYFVDANPPLATPFGNPNHAAGYLLLTSTVALGLALRAGSREKSWFWASGYVVMGTALMLTLSRGGIFFFFATQLLFAFLLLRPWRRRQRFADEAPSGQRRRWRPVWILTAAFGVASVAAYIAYADISGELATADSVEKVKGSKIAFWPAIAQSAWEFARTGMGRGAFEGGFARFQKVLPIESSFTHAENLPLQLAAEDGLPAALLLAALALLGFAPLANRALSRAELSPFELAALSASMGLLLHNCFDFNLELPACAAAFWILLGTLARSEPSGEDEPKVLPVSHARLWALGTAALAVVSLVMGRHSVRAAEETLRAAYQKGANGPQLEELAVPLIDRHPADYLLFSWVGAAYAERKPRRPGKVLAFVNRTLYLRPATWNAHVTAARALLDLKHRSQALLEYRFAYEASPANAKSVVVDEAARFAKEPEELEAIVPQNPADLSTVVGRLIAANRVNDAREVLRFALEELPPEGDAAKLWLLAARLHLRAEDVDQAEAAIAEAERLDPQDVEVALVKSDILTREKRPDEAILLLEHLTSRKPQEQALAVALVNTYLQVGRTSAARAVIARARPFAPSADDRASLMLLEGQSYDNEGMALRALKSYRDASRIAPRSISLHSLVARTLESLHRYSEAQDEVREIIRLAPQSAQERAWLARLEEEKRSDREALLKSRLAERDAGSGDADDALFAPR